MRRLALAIVGIAGIAGSTHAATFASVGADGIRMTGDIEQGDAERFRTLLATLDKRGLVIARIFLDSPGGDSWTALALANAVRERRLATVIGADGYCASACVAMFAGGVKRTVFPDSILGVHSARLVVKDADGAETLVETDGSVAATVEITRAMKKLGAPARVTDKLLATPGSDIAWLDAADLAAWNVEVIGGDYQPFSPVERVAVLVRTSPGWLQILFSVVLSGAAGFAGGAALFAGGKLLRRTGKRMREGFA